MPVLLETDPYLSDALAAAIGPRTVVVTDIVAVQRRLSDKPSEDLVVIGPAVELVVATEFASAERRERPTNGVILVRRRVDTTVLREALRSGIREVVKVDDLKALTEACRQSRELSRITRGDSGQEPDPSERLGQLITVFSAKGGCGKTTLATNLAASIARFERSVCLVDLDLAFGDVAIALQLFPTHSVADAVGLSAGFDVTALQGLVTHYNEHLDALLAPIEPGAGESVPADVVATLMHALKRQYDYVVVDTPPAFNDQVLAACDATDQFVLIATLDIPALKNLKLTLEMLDLLGYSRDRRRLVLNRSDSKVGLSVSDAQKTLATPIACEVPSSGAVSASINRGVPIVLDQPHHPVSHAIRSFAESLLVTEQAAIHLPHQHRRGFSLRRRTGATA